jgi:serine/threonine protein kinase
VRAKIAATSLYVSIVSLSLFVVFRARRKKDGVIVALKKIACAGVEDANRALQEGKMLLELHHDGICEHYDFFLYSEGAKISVCLVMSLCNGGDLFQQLERLHKEGRRLEEAKLLDWTRQLVAGDSSALFSLPFH